MNYFAFQQQLFNQAYCYYLAMFHSNPQLLVQQIQGLQPLPPNSESVFKKFSSCMQPDISPSPTNESVNMDNNNSVPELSRNRKPWHMASHKLFRKAIRRQLSVFLNDPQLICVKNRLDSIGYDLEKFSRALESKMYYEADCLEEYLEYTTLKKRMCEQLKKVRKIVIRS